ncbi:hypothetical protein C1I95_24535 [Micromonospora craterilacus]|uniref:Uncharacterized protein n=1 Tax=Micromonospora craterilacus TaxID=1655439 RepID=A0A2W2DM43_9ACTN|nr:hypothetical protein [Micromonospora craterilacus]PZG13026.1 hypothetical protein C1I95_24535 [Micromonospora craterilacus]
MPEKHFWTDDHAALKATRLLLAAIDDAEGHGQNDGEFEFLDPIEQGQALIGLVELSIHLAYEAYGSKARAEIAGMASLIEAVGVRKPQE